MELKKTVCYEDFGAVGDGKTDDIDAIKRAHEYAKKYGVKAYTDYDELLRDPDIDAVTICTPSGMHANQAISALKRDKHVLLEKPMALNSGDAKRICDEVERSSKLLSVIFQMRYTDDIQYIKKLLDESERRGIPAMDISVYHKGREVFREIRGTMDEDGTPLTEKTLFNISIIFIYWI